MLDLDEIRRKWRGLVSLSADYEATGKADKGVSGADVVRVLEWGSPGFKEGEEGGDLLPVGAGDSPPKRFEISADAAQCPDNPHARPLVLA